MWFAIEKWYQTAFFCIIKYRNAGARAHNVHVRVRRWFRMAADREGDKKIPDTFQSFVG